MNDTEKLISNISQGKNLTFDESKKIFLDIMSGNIKEESIYKFFCWFNKDYKEPQILQK